MRKREAEERREDIELEICKAELAERRAARKAELKLKEAELGLKEYEAANQDTYVAKVKFSVMRCGHLRYVWAMTQLRLLRFL